MGKEHANKGVERNKKPLQNIIYKVDVSQLKNKSEDNLEKMDKYRFKDEGYLVLSWGYEKNINKGDSFFWHGFITPDFLEELIGSKQWSKFCGGKREFTIQRRIDGKNISNK